MSDVNLDEVRRTREGKPCGGPILASFGHRIAPGAGLLVRASERVPFLQGRPDPFAGFLSAVPDAGEIDAGDDAVFHDHLAVDDHGIDIVTHTALDDALHRVAHRPVAQRVAAGEIDDDDV